MTTNRVRSFDEAFQSRIHVALHYEDLSPDAKRKIWIAFLKKARDSSPVLTPASAKLNGIVKTGANRTGTHAEFSHDDLRALGEKKVNGRQIKNVVRTASALAGARKELVGYEHLVEVLNLMEQFEARFVGLSYVLTVTEIWFGHSNAMYQ